MKQETKATIRKYVNDLVNINIDVKRTLVSLVWLVLYGFLIGLVSLNFFEFLFTKTGYPIEKWGSIPSLLAWTFTIVWIVVRFPIYEKHTISRDYNWGWKDGHEQGYKIGYETAKFEMEKRARK